MIDRGIDFQKSKSAGIQFHMLKRTGSKKGGREKEKKKKRMPLGKYHCDYCDKQFQDTPSARKRHIQGLQHQRAKALWYESFKEPYRNQGEIFGNGVCNHFVRTGFCQYGDSCRYFHPKQIIQNPNSGGVLITTTSFTETVQSPARNQLAGSGGGGSVPVDIIRDNVGVSLGNLPPSLRPPPEGGGGYHPLPFVDWG